MLNWKLNDPSWLISRDRYIRSEDGLYESLFALSNGNVGIRATVDFIAGGGRPGCFFHDLYGNGLAVKKELVNALNFSYWSLYIDGYPVHFHETDILSFRHGLDLLGASVFLEVLFRDSYGRKTKFSVYYCLPAPHTDLMLTQFEITTVNHSAPIRLDSGVDWSTGNGYMGGTVPHVRLDHLEVDHCNRIIQRLRVGAWNRSDQRRVAVDIRHFCSGAVLLSNRSNHSFSESAVFDGKSDTPNRLVRLAAFNTGSYKSYTKLFDALDTKIDDFDEPGLQDLLDTHMDSWKKSWNLASVDIDGPVRDIEGLRFGIFHLIQAPRKDIEATNVSARGLTSEYHSGHVFFNSEYYLVPYYCLFDPATARRLIMQRIGTLGAAKAFAQETGFKGARFPEEADMDGRPAAPFKIKDLFSGKESTEWSGVEVVHISADIIMAVRLYLESTGDTSIMDAAFFDFLTQIAVFCSDLLKYVPSRNGYSATRVMCFDEFHYHVDHHYATNFLCSRAISWISQLIDRLLEQNNEALVKVLADNGIEEDTRRNWLKVAESVYLPAPNADGVIPQFEGYFSLEDDRIGARGVNMLPDIDPDTEEKLASLTGFETQLIKQADVVFLMSLFPECFDMEITRANFNYYEERTLHGSSLSMTPHASVAARLGLSQLAYNYIVTALRYNLDFNPRNDYRNGVHLGGYAGAVASIVKDILGFRASDNNIFFLPRLPNEWNSIQTRIVWRNHSFKIFAGKSFLSVEKTSGNEDDELLFHVGSLVKPLKKNNTEIRFELN